MNQDGKNDKVMRIYADGVYDMFHFGHARQLEQAKKLFPNVHLVVGVCGQDDVIKFKGQPVMTGEQRVLGPVHCKWVDEVIYPAPWILTEKFLTDNKIDFVAHDEIPDLTAGDDCYALVKKLGKFKITQRTEGVSTSELINKILFDRNGYVRRNISRGYSRKELGLNLVEYYFFKIDIAVRKVICPKKKQKSQ